MSAATQPDALIAALLVDTHALVQCALWGQWDSMFNIAEHRRACLQQIHVLPANAIEAGALQALSNAIQESEQTLASIVAHAIAQAQQRMALG